MCTRALAQANEYEEDVHLLPLGRNITENELSWLKPQKALAGGKKKKNPKLHCLAGHSNYPGILRISVRVFHQSSCFCYFLLLAATPSQSGESLLATHRIATKILRSSLTAQSRAMESAS